MGSGWIGYSARTHTVFIRIDKAVVCIETDHTENDTISFYMNYLHVNMEETFETLNIEYTCRLSVY